MPAAFIGADDLTAYLRFPAGVLDSDMSLIALDSACQVVRDWCEQNFTTTTYTDKWLSGNGTVLLNLGAFPIVSVTSLRIYSTDRVTFEDLIENTDYVLDSDRGLCFRVDDGVFSYGKLNIKSTYTVGYDIVPSPVRLVALQVAARIYEFGQAENVSTGQVSVSYVQGGGSLLPQEKDMLRRYKVVS